MNKLQQYILSDSQGGELHITNFGARMVKWQIIVDGVQRNIILGYDRLEDYLSDDAYLGAIVGPYANRIGTSQVTIDGKNHQLNANEGNNHLHGGPNSIDKHYWDFEQRTHNAITLSCKLAENFNGYPGSINIEVCYQLNHNKLTVTLNLCSNQTTIAGPTCHPYFNLAGVNQCSQNHQLQLSAKYYTPVCENHIPTGAIEPIKNSRYDYNKTTTLPHGSNGLDDNFLLTPNININDKLQHHATLTAPDNKLSLAVASNYPALQLYTGQHLTAPFNPYDGICLEPQFCPNSPNQANFPFEYLIADKPKEFIIEYQLVKAL